MPVTAFLKSATFERVAVSSHPWEEVPLRSFSPRPGWQLSRRCCRAVIPGLILACGLLSACSGVPAAPRSAASPPSLVAVKPQASWADGILYFAIVDRFADGDAAND